MVYILLSFVVIGTLLVLLTFLVVNGITFIDKVIDTIGPKIQKWSNEKKKKAEITAKRKKFPQYASMEMFNVIENKYTKLTRKIKFSNGIQDSYTKINKVNMRLGEVKGLLDKNYQKEEIKNVLLEYEMFFAYVLSAMEENWEVVSNPETDFFKDMTDMFELFIVEIEDVHEKKQQEELERKEKESIYKRIEEEKLLKKTEERMSQDMKTMLRVTQKQNEMKRFKK